METGVKKRGWVKNVAIIFLSVLLVLTFLSNTIMNRSLPEVAAQYVESGSITTQVRGTGTVEAVESYEVKLSQSRTVQSVMVKVGDTVEVGDTLLYLSGDVSEELKAAEDELDDLELAYQKALIEATASDYAKENRDIQNARTALQEAEAERDALYISDEAIAAAKTALDEAKAQVSAAEASVTAAQASVDTAQASLDELGGKQEGSSGDYTAVTEAQNALTAAKNSLTAIMLQYGTDYETFEATAEKNRGANSLEAYMMFLAATYSQYAPPAAGEDTRTEAQKSAYNQYLAYEAVTEAESAVTSAQLAYNSALSAYNSSGSAGNVTEWNRRNTVLTNAKSVLTQAEKEKSQAEAEQTDAQTAYDEALQKQTDYKTAKDTVKSCETALEDLVFALQEQQKSDDITQQTTALDLAAQKADIEEKEEEVASLRSDMTGAEVESSVNGTVKTIGVTAGDTAPADTALMTIEVGDRGYSLSFSVTVEQSRKVKVGDTAEVSNYYWGGDITAVLSGIRSDPENPQTNKILTFSVSGDVEDGTQLTLSVGQRSASYDMIVPNSAIRSDSNGSFVLIVVAKSSPLGNRYTAQRADVTVIASDDTSSAVSGALASGDYVITTSTAPIEAGTLVRIAES